MSEQTKKDFLTSIAEQKNLQKEKEKQKHQDNDDDEYDWNDYDDEEDEINQQAKNLSKVQLNTELKPKTITGLKDYFFTPTDNSARDNNKGTKYKKKDYGSSSNATSQYNRFNTYNYNQQYDNSSQDDVIINNNSAYSKKPKYYNKQYGYTSDTKKYSNLNNKRDNNYNRNEYINDEQYLSLSNNENIDIKAQPKKYNREYTDYNKRNQYQQYHEQYKNNYSNRNQQQHQGYYSNKYINDYEEYDDNEPVEDIQKPMFVNSKLEGENNFTALKKEDDLFLKKFLKRQSEEDLVSKDKNQDDDKNKDKEDVKDTAISLSTEHKKEEKINDINKEKSNKSINNENTKTQGEEKKDTIIVNTEQKKEESFKEMPIEKKEEATITIQDQIDTDQQNDEDNKQKNNELSDKKQTTEESFDTYQSYTTRPEGNYYKRNYYGNSDSYQYHPYSYQYNAYSYQNRRGGRYNPYYNNNKNYYNNHYYNNYNNQYYNNAEYNNRGYNDSNYNQNDYNNEEQYNENKKLVNEKKKESEKKVEKIVEAGGNKVTIIFKNAKSLKELFK